jgi:hypothetical protein
MNKFNMPKIVEIKSRVLELGVCCSLRTRQNHKFFFVGLNLRPPGTKSVPLVRNKSSPLPPILVFVSSNICIYIYIYIEL